MEFLLVFIGCLILASPLIIAGLVCLAVWLRRLKKKNERSVPLMIAWICCFGVSAAFAVFVTVLGLIFGFDVDTDGQQQEIQQSEQSASSSEQASDEELQEQERQAEEQRKEAEQEREEQKAALKDKINEALTYSGNDYTPETFNALSEAVTTANEVIADPDSTESQFDSARRNIQSKIDALEKPKVYESIPYTDIARNPDSYKGKYVTFTGRVLQVQESGSDVVLRVATDGEYDDVVLVSYDSSIMGGTRVLEDDSVTVNGTCAGVVTYTSTLNAQITIPGMKADSVTIN